MGNKVTKEIRMTKDDPRYHDYIREWYKKLPEQDKKSYIAEAFNAGVKVNNADAMADYIINRDKYQKANQERIQKTYKQPVGSKKVKNNDGTTSQITKNTDTGKDVEVSRDTNVNGQPISIKYSPEAAQALSKATGKQITEDNYFNEAQAALNYHGKKTAKFVEGMQTFANTAAQVAGGMALAPALTAGRATQAANAAGKTTSAADKITNGARYLWKQVPFIAASQAADKITDAAGITYENNPYTKAMIDGALTVWGGKGIGNLFALGNRFAPKALSKVITPLTSQAYTGVAGAKGLLGALGLDTAAGAGTGLAFEEVSKDLGKVKDWAIDQLPVLTTEKKQNLKDKVGTAGNLASFVLLPKLLSKAPQIGARWADMASGQKADWAPAKKFFMSTLTGRQNQLFGRANILNYFSNKNKLPFGTAVTTEGIRPGNQGIIRTTVPENAVYTKTGEPIRAQPEFIPLNEAQYSSSRVPTGFEVKHGVIGRTDHSDVLTNLASKYASGNPRSVSGREMKLVLAQNRPSDEILARSIVLDQQGKPTGEHLSVENLGKYMRAQKNANPAVAETGMQGKSGRYVLVADYGGQHVVPLFDPITGKTFYMHLDLRGPGSAARKTVESSGTKSNDIKATQSTEQVPEQPMSAVQRANNYVKKGVSFVGHNVVKPSFNEALMSNMDGQNVSIAFSNGPKTFAKNGNGLEKTWLLYE